MDLDEIERAAKALQAVYGKLRSEGVTVGELNAARQAYDDVSTPDVVLALIAEVRALRERLEIDPSHPYDGIYCRDETIRLQGEEIERLRDIQAANVEIKMALHMKTLDLAEENIALQDEVRALREGMQRIASIEDKMVGGDWDEIEEARAIAREALGGAK
jgi:sugar phosphate isomerase/epimerase